ncbi:MAG: LicD family protein [Steroidobacteraceae bacterium]
MRTLNEYLWRARWGPLEDRRRRGLVLLHQVLSDAGLRGKYWMTMGLLLGCMRDGGPIAWDRDSDFGFLEDDLPQFVKGIRRLREQGYELRAPQVNNDGRVTLWTLRFQAAKYEFFQFERQGSNLRWFFHRRRPPPLEMAAEVPAHGLAAFELYGLRWQIPGNADEVLSRIYGDWRKPNPHYVSWRDCGAIVDRYPWTGERRPAD